MAQESPALANQAGSYGAEQLRRAIFFGFGLAGGVKNAGDLNVTWSSGTTVNVATGEVLITGDNTTGPNAVSLYYGLNSSTTALTPSANGTANPRVDLLCATVDDSAYSGGADDWKLQIVAGTATSGANLSNLTNAGALPSYSIIIAYLLVPANNAAMTQANILDQRVFAFDAVPNGNVVFKSGTYSALLGDTVCATANSFTVTSPAHRKGSGFTVINQGTGVVTVSAVSGNIQAPGFTSASSCKLTQTGQYAQFESDGTSYNLVAGSVTAYGVPGVQKYFTGSGTYTTPNDGQTHTYRITAQGGGGGGGGGGGAYTGGSPAPGGSGGGGGGGDQTISTQTLGPNVTMTVTVGGGGNAGTVGANSASAPTSGGNGGVGGNSAVSAAGLATVTASGGANGGTLGVHATSGTAGNGGTGGNLGGTGAGGGAGGVAGSGTAGTLGGGGGGAAISFTVAGAGAAAPGGPSGGGGGGGGASTGGAGGTIGVGGAASGSATTAGTVGALGCGGGGGCGGNNIGPVAPGAGGAGGAGWVSIEILN